jgi:PAS domain-containing protein
MLQTGSPSGAPAALASLGEGEGKLALLEFMLASVDLQASARRALDWLVSHLHIHHAFVATIDPTSRHLAILAERGLADSVASDFALSLEDDTHPLIRAMHGSVPAYFERAPLFFRGAAETPSHVVPLGTHHSDDAGEPVGGVLFVAAATPEIHPEVLWLADVFSRQLQRLQTRRELADSRLGQERMLLYSIINAVTDPILLTDPEGRLLIANARAEKLFSAPDDASEGWRRAVSLNNMLFSAALSTTAVEEKTPEPARRELLLVDPLEGSDLVFELLSSRAKDERQGTYVVSVLRNVTDLAKAKEEIEESYRTLRLAQAEVRDERHRLDLIGACAPTARTSHRSCRACWPAATNSGTAARSTSSIRRRGSRPRSRRSRGRSSRNSASSRGSSRFSTTSGRRWRRRGSTCSSRTRLRRLRKRCRRRPRSWRTRTSCCGGSSSFSSRPRRSRRSS